MAKKQLGLTSAATERARMRSGGANIAKKLTGIEGIYLSGVFGEGNQATAKTSMTDKQVREQTKGSVKIAGRAPGIFVG